MKMIDVGFNCEVKIRVITRLSFEPVKITTDMPRQQTKGLLNESLATTGRTPSSLWNQHEFR